MKLTKCILGCALAAGLMIFATDKTQAGVVIGSQLFSPMKLKLTVGVYNDNGDLKKVSITSKEVLKMLGYPKGAQLAIIDGMVNYNSIFVINKDSVLENLTAEGILTANLNELLDNYPSDGKNGSFKYSSSGVMTLNFYSSPVLISGVFPMEFAPLFITNPDIDHTASEEASDYWFEVSGLYAYSEKGSAVNNAGDRNLSTKLKAAQLGGTGYDVDLNSDYPTTVAGNLSAKGNGKVAAISIF